MEEKGKMKGREGGGKRKRERKGKIMEVLHGREGKGGKVTEREGRR